MVSICSFIFPVILKQVFPKKSLYWFQQLIFWSCQIKFSCFKYSSPLEHKLSKYHMLTNSSLIRAGASGAGMGDKPRWVRILLITGGSLIEAMIFIFSIAVDAFWNIDIKHSGKKSGPRTFLKRRAFVWIFVFFFFCFDLCSCKTWDHSRSHLCIRG